MRNFITGIRKHLNRTKYSRVKFDCIKFRNMWATPYYLWRYDGIFIGIGRHYFSSTEFCYKIVFFGLSLHIWMKKEFKN